MDFTSKIELCRSLAAANYIAADKALLRTAQPGDNLLHAIGNNTEFDKQLLWALLDHFSPEEIKSFRDKNKTDAPNPIISKQSNNSNTKSSEKKKSKKKKNIEILDGIISKTKQCRKQLLSIMIG